MDKSKRKELLEQYKEIKTYMGVIQVRNKETGQIFLDSYPNLKNKWLTIQTQLDMGRFSNAGLQKDWKEQGAGAFEYEVLEQKDAGEITDIRWEQKQMLKRWLAKLEPYGDKGYNRPPRD